MRGATFVFNSPHTRRAKCQRQSTRMVTKVEGDERTRKERAQLSEVYCRVGSLGSDCPAENPVTDTIFGRDPRYRSELWTRSQIQIRTLAEIPDTDPNFGRDPRYRSELWTRSQIQIRTLDEIPDIDLTCYGPWPLALLVTESARRLLSWSSTSWILDCSWFSLGLLVPVLVEVLGDPEVLGEPRARVSSDPDPGPEPSTCRRTSCVCVGVYKV